MIFQIILGVSLAFLIIVVIGTYVNWIAKFAGLNAAVTYEEVFGKKIRHKSHLILIGKKICG